jgi:hypothetical protein
MCKHHIQSSLLKGNNNSRKRWQNLLLILGIGEENDKSIWLCNCYIFLCHKPLPKKWWWSTTVSKWFGVLYLQRLWAIVHLQEHSASKVSFNLMPSCSKKNSVFSCERSVACHGQKDNGPKRFAESCIYNNGLYQFWATNFGTLPISKPFEVKIFLLHIIGGQRS